MALTFQDDQEKHDSNTHDAMNCGARNSSAPQQFKYNPGAKPFLPKESKSMTHTSFLNATSSTPKQPTQNSQSPNRSYQDVFSGNMNFNLKSLNELPDHFNGFPFDDTTANGSDSMLTSWLSSVDPGQHPDIFDQHPSTDSFGLNSSTASSGFGALDEMVSKILEDEHSLTIGSNNSNLSDCSHESRPNSDMLAYDSPSNNMFGGAWSNGINNSSPLSKIGREDSFLSYDKCKINNAVASSPWSFGTDSVGNSAGMFPKDNSTLNNLLKTSLEQNNQSSPLSLRDRVRLAKDSYQDTYPFNQGDFGRSDYPPFNIKDGSEGTAIRGRGEYKGSPNSKPIDGANLFGMLGHDKRKLEKMHMNNFQENYSNKHGGSDSCATPLNASSTKNNLGRFTPNGFSSQSNMYTSTSGRDSHGQFSPHSVQNEAHHPAQNGQDFNLEREIISQALASQLNAHLGSSSAEIQAAKERIQETMAVLEHLQKQQALQNNISTGNNTIPMSQNHFPNHHLNMPNLGFQSNRSENIKNGVSWSGPNAHNHSSGKFTKSDFSMAQMHEQKLPPQSQISPQALKTANREEKHDMGIPQNGYSGSNKQQRSRLPQCFDNTNRENCFAKIDSRNARSNMTTPDPLSVDCGPFHPYHKDFPFPPRGPVLHPDEMIAPDAMGMFAPVPLPGQPFKYPPNFSPYLHGHPGDGLEFFPPFDPFLHGRLPFIGGNPDMLLEMLPPQFYGLPHFFPGFRPPRRTGPSNELHIKLEECYDQFKNLERKKKKVPTATLR